MVYFSALKCIRGLRIAWKKRIEYHGAVNTIEREKEDISRLGVFKFCQRTRFFREDSITLDSIFEF